MSQRTILEVNHDCAKIDPGDMARFCSLWNRAIASGDKESWAELELSWGVRQVTCCHHSEDRKLVVGNGSLQREYAIG